MSAQSGGVAANARLPAATRIGAVSCAVHAPCMRQRRQRQDVTLVSAQVD
ncbi:hypothetical protein [Sodalis sp.]